MNTTPVFPVEARPNRATRRFTLSRRRQRKGQALILAVLVMLMIAVLSAGFLVVVSGNLNQTARVTDKTRAVESARSGLKFVNDQLTYSQLGEKWRPGYIPTATTDEPKLLSQGESRIPSANDPSRSIYYSPVDIANGWAGRFAKFPDPLAPRSDAPQYLARVQQIPNELDAGDADATDVAKQGMLRLTVIGLSNDDPAAFSKVVAYKGGSSAPMGRVIRVVDNFDFQNKTVPQGMANYTKASQTLVIASPQGNFPGVSTSTALAPVAPFPVMVGNAGGAILKSSVVDQASKDATTGAVTLHLAEEPFGADVSNVRAVMAAQLGASVPSGTTGGESAVDFNNDTTIGTDEYTSLPVSSSGAGGAWANGGLALTGAVSLPALDAGTGQTVRASDLILQQAPTTVSKATVSTSAASTTPLDLASSSNATGFPGAGIPPELVRDGADRLQNNPAGDRNVDVFTPPDISSSAGAGRYRRMTRDSQSTVAGQPDAANYGYGQGIYINNPTDRERIKDGTNLRDMRQDELVKMWLSRKADGTPDTSASFNRTGIPEVISDNTKSLEERHMRGWVGPDEFHARGALVELIPNTSGTGDPQIAVTFDARQDSDGTLAPAITPNVTDAVNKKAAKSPAGATLPGVYRTVFNWPADGVIFAEGNIRIRGKVTGAPRSLTVVSQNNIYIDGELQADGTANAKKVLLLARRNVVVNPTALVSRVEGVTLFQSADPGAPADPTAGTPAIPPTMVVTDGSIFQNGDWINAGTGASSLARIVGVSANTLTLDRAVSPAAGSVVSAVADPVDIVGTGPDTKVRTTWEKLSNPTQVIQRRLPLTTGSIRLALLHSGEPRDAFKVSVDTTAGGPAPSTADLIAKYAVASTETDPTQNTLFVPGAVTVDPADKQKSIAIKQDDPSADIFNLTDYATLDTFNSTPPPPPHGSAAPPATPKWVYKFEALNGYGSIPSIALAGVGSRKLPTDTTNTGFWKRSILPSGFTMQVATSVTPTFGSVTGATPLTTDRWGQAPVQVSAFGFAPTPSALEDILTADTGFYVPDATGATPQVFTRDSRTIPVPSGATGSQTFGLSIPTVAGFDYTTATATNKMPFYRLGALKLENLVPDPAPGLNGEVKFSGVQPVNMNINAFVYAQYGSWFVIPAPLFDDTAKNSQDANRDGQTNDGSDPVNAYRFARYNYKINFTGAIAENQTAIVNSVGTITGAVQQWSNSWANVTTTATAVAQDANSKPIQNAGVVYNFDPSYANTPTGLDDGFVMPQSDQLTYVE